MNVTIKDVARAAGVSKATVSRYFNDITRVNEETAERIRTVVEELHYIPNATARNLVLRQTDKLGVLVSNVDSVYWNRILKSVHNYISQIPDPYEIFTLNCDNIVLYNTNKSILDKIQVLAEQRVAGIMIALRDLQQVDIDYMFSQDIPFVVVQSGTDDERVSCVNVDNYKATYEAASYLMQLGHRNIAYVSGPTDAVYANERFEGFRDALMTRRLYRRNLIINGDNDYDDGYWRMRQILTWKPVPTAVMFGSDSMAYGAISAIHEAGLKIPDDLSVIGYDGLTEEVKIYELLPPLTTIYQPMTLIGEKLAEIMLRRIRDKSLGKNKAYRVTLPTQFLDRGSCRSIEE